MQCFDVAVVHVCHNFRILSVSCTHSVRSTVELAAFPLVKGEFGMLERVERDKGS